MYDMYNVNYYVIHSYKLLTTIYQEENICNLIHQYLN